MTGCRHLGRCEDGGSRPGGQAKPWTCPGWCAHNLTRPRVPTYLAGAIHAKGRTGILRRHSFAPDLLHCSCAAVIAVPFDCVPSAVRRHAVTNSDQVTLDVAAATTLVLSGAPELGVFRLRGVWRNGQTHGLIVGMAAVPLEPGPRAEALRAAVELRPAASIRT